MKTCTKCNISKKTSEFFVRDKSTGRLHAQCKDCYSIQRKTFQKDHYMKYRTSYLERAKKRRAKLRIEFRENMLAYLSDKHCEICGEDDKRVLEFDHLNMESKSFGISYAVSLGYKWNDVLIEIAKCRILCSNCHKKHTAEQFGWYKS